MSHQSREPRAIPTIVFAILSEIASGHWSSQGALSSIQNVPLNLLFTNLVTEDLTKHRAVAWVGCRVLALTIRHRLLEKYPDLPLKAVATLQYALLRRRVHVAMMWQDGVIVGSVTSGDITLSSDVLMAYFGTHYNALGLKQTMELIGRIYGGLLDAAVAAVRLWESKTGERLLDSSNDNLQPVRHVDANHLGTALVALNHAEFGGRRLPDYCEEYRATASSSEHATRIALGHDALAAILALLIFKKFPDIPSHALDSLTRPVLHESFTRHILCRAGQTPEAGDGDHFPVLYWAGCRALVYDANALHMLAETFIQPSFIALCHSHVALYLPGGGLPLSPTEKPSYNNAMQHLLSYYIECGVLGLMHTPPPPGQIMVDLPDLNSLMGEDDPSKARDEAIQEQTAEVFQSLDSFLKRDDYVPPHLCPILAPHLLQAGSTFPLHIFGHTVTVRSHAGNPVGYIRDGQYPRVTGTGLEFRGERFIGPSFKSLFGEDDWLCLCQLEVRLSYDGQSIHIMYNKRLNAHFVANLNETRRQLGRVRGTWSFLPDDIVQRWAYDIIKAKAVNYRFWIG
ncbi:hypothetical protein FB107DRAFT_272357 [Schizophyllum commune]